MDVKSNQREFDEKKFDKKTIKSVGRGFISRRNEQFEFLHGGSKPHKRELKRS